MCYIMTFHYPLLSLKKCVVAVTYRPVLTLLLFSPNIQGGMVKIILTSSNGKIVYNLLKHSSTITFEWISVLPEGYCFLVKTESVGRAVLSTNLY